MGTQTPNMMADFSVVCVFLSLLLSSCLQPGCCRYQQIDLTSSSSGVSCSSSSVYTGSLDCKGALNGNTATTWKPANAPDKNCFYTGPNQGENYWQVDLGQTHNIHRITIYPDMGSPGFMVNIAVHVGQTRVFTFPSDKDNIQNPTVITNNLPLRGDIIRLTKTKAYVVLCELQVEGCVSGSYGAECQETCSQPVGCQPDTCDSITGNCTCRPGWSPPQCAVCADGYYGDSCSETCSAGCRDTCNKQDGTCDCKTEWSGDKCDVCADGYYGASCSETCSAGCRDTCSKQDGTCNCKTEWSGDKCDACISGRYGPNCQDTCSAGCRDTACNKNGGTCSPCRTGWDGTKCDVCADGYYGASCSETCSTGCSNTCNKQDGTCDCKTGWSGDKCDVCADGYYGASCGNTCSVGCSNTCNKQDGTCSCREGWSGTKCDACISGRYGPDCQNTCSAGCRDTACNKNGGTCSPCRTGWDGTKCDVCADGYYGVSCGETCSTGCSNTCKKQDGTCNCRGGWTGTKCDACSDGYYSNTTTGSSDCRKCGDGCVTTSCEDFTGNCTCKPGWQAPTCQECAPGQFGGDCQQTCSVGCNEICDLDNGECPCKEGWFGATCEVCAVGYYNNSVSRIPTAEDCIPCGSGCSGTCDGQSGYCTCRPGWKPPFCDQVCDADTFGQNCSLPCAPGCDGTCDAVKGNCTCGSQWIQPNCTDCSPGYYSPEEGCKPCNDGCENVTSCDPRTGACQACSPGFYGETCFSPCTNCAGNGICGKQTGECEAGCDEGFTGPTCAQPLKDEDEQKIAPIAGGVVGAVLVLLIVVVIIIVFRRRRQRAGSKASYGEVSNGGKDLSEESSKGLSMEAPRQSDSKPTGAVKPMKRTDTSQKSTSAGHVYGNMSETDMNSGVDGNLYANIPRPTNNNNNAVTSAPNTHNVPSRGTANAANARPSSAAPRRDVVYENVTLPARSGQASQPARPAQASRPPVGPKPVPHPAVTSRRSQGDDLPELDDDDKYNSEDLYGSFKSLSSTQQLDAFQRYLIACLGSGELADQFDKLPKGMTRPHKIGLSEENKRKNRFKAMCTYDFNRVILRRPEGDNSSDYINATYITGADREKQYIATQGPRVNTIDDLWWMVWQEGITQLVMLANLQEDGRDKCEQYWPASGKSQTYGHVTVRAFEEQQRADYVIRSFLLKAKGSSGERQVTQYHYMAWPDHGVPLAASLVDYWRYVKGRTTSTVPLLVHCSAGVGRTGTFIALDIAYDQESRGRDVNVNEIVTKLREERCLMVQSEAQYKFLHEVILEAHTSRDTRIPMNQFDVRFPGTIRLNTDNAVIDKEFLMLKQMGQFAGKAKHTMATMPENLDKNRNMDALPDDDHVVYLNAYVRGRNQYINGVYMSSFQQQKGFVLTQLPIPDNTLVDFWRLVEGCGVSTVISIGSEEEEKTVTNYCRYWPREAGEVLTTGPYKVTLITSTILSEHASSYKLAFKTPSEDRSREVELLHYRKWAGEVPSDTSSLLQLVDTVKAKQTDDVTTSAKGAKPDDIKPPVVVQCIDGAAKSGLFCALYDVISRVTYDEEVDVYLTAREVQRIRPQAVATQTQYRYLYQALQEYIRHLDVYQNV